MGKSEERAVKDFTDIVYELYRKIGEENNFGKSFRSRAREIPSFLYEVGFLPALSFIYSKAEAQKYNLIVRFARERDLPATELKGVNSVEGGYAAYLYLLLLETSRILSNMRLDPSNPLSCINSLSGHGNLLIVLPQLLMPYLLELKRLAEATLPGE
ncbi:MAG: type III-B CRISPR module-associated protein Cmr5 [Candidatus Methanodesulfokora sp.]|jgi:CRISPR type III-B/RAMP module-associated protein Cmr5